MRSSYQKAADAAAWQISLHPKSDINQHRQNVARIEPQESGSETTQNMTFKDLNLSEKVLAAIEAAGYTTPTPIQAQAIPVALQGRDVVGIAQTGTGKTGAFLLPLLSMLEKGRARARMPRSLILEPTRELAAQVAESLEKLGANHKLTVSLLIGGVSFDDQERKLERGADILIATPGRLLDHFGRGKLLLTSVDFLVIDEADRMLDMGFIPDIERICKLLPPSRQTLFFSATMPPEIQKLTEQFLRDPEQIRVAPPATTAKSITQKLKFAPADSKAKRQILRDLMREQAEGTKNAIIFCNRKKDVAILHKSLVKHGFNAGALHGDMDQRQRMATLDAFRRGEITYLAASDVAARGLDIPEVSHVFNFDVPVSPEDYVHRIGRTGRAGRDGYAAMLVTPKEMKAVRAIETLCKEKIEWIGGEPSTENLTSADFSGTSERRRGRERGKGKDEQRREAPQQSSAEVRAFPQRQRQPQERRHRDGSSVSKYHRELLPPATSAPVVGLGDHVPAFLKRPVRIAG
jgi:superfamily II DNA/RNA helicase